MADGWVGTSFGVTAEYIFIGLCNVLKFCNSCNYRGKAAGIIFRFLFCNNRKNVTAKYGTWYARAHTHTQMLNAKYLEIVKVFFDHLHVSKIHRSG